MNTEPLGLLLYHHVLMIIGCTTIALLWGVSGAPYGIPRLIFFLFGVVSPMIQMFFSILLSFTSLRTSIFLLCPISFGLLVLLGGNARGRRRRNRSLAVVLAGWVFCLAVAAPVLLLDRQLFVGVLSVWLFLLWYSGGQAS